MRRKDGRPVGRHRVKSHYCKGRWRTSFWRGHGLIKGRPPSQRMLVSYSKPNIEIPEPKEIQWNEYSRQSQQRIWMKPEEFLQLVASPNGFTDSSIKSIETRLRKGEPLWSLRLDVRPDGQVVGHEGRHRAYVGMKHGWKKVPVIIWHEDEAGHLKIAEKRFSIPNLKQEVGYYPYSAWMLAREKLQKER